jgi:hypothetical protein
MRTVVLEPVPHEIEALSERRKRLGLDTHDEVLIVDPHKRTVDWFAQRDAEYESVKRSELLDLSAAELAAQIDWPPV